MLVLFQLADVAVGQRHCLLAQNQDTIIGKAELLGHFGLLVHDYELVLVYYALIFVKIVLDASAATLQGHDIRFALTVLQGLEERLVGVEADLPRVQALVLGGLGLHAHYYNNDIEVSIRNC